mgnify:CR=1 FL=1
MINRVILLGNLGADPEVRYLPSGGQVTSLRVATTMRYKDKDSGERKEVTEWHRVTFFNALAEISGTYLKKGSQIYLEGRLQTRKWQAQDGTDRYTTEIVGNELIMLGSRNTSASAVDNDKPDYHNNRSPTAPPLPSDDFDDFPDIPF